MPTTLGLDPGTRTAGVCILGDAGPLWMASQHAGAWRVWTGAAWVVVDALPMAALAGACRDYGVCLAAVERVAFFARGPGGTGRMAGGQLVAMADAGGRYAGAVEAAGVPVLRPLATEWRRVLGLPHHAPARDAEAAAITAALTAGVDLPRGPRGGLSEAGAVAEAWAMARWARERSQGPFRPPDDVPRRGHPKTPSTGRRSRG